VGARIASDIVVGGQRVQQRQRRDLRLPDQAERHAALVGGLKQGVPWPKVVERQPCQQLATDRSGEHFRREPAPRVVAAVPGLMAGKGAAALRWLGRWRSLNHRGRSKSSKALLYDQVRIPMPSHRQSIWRQSRRRVHHH
jgi:hypothetical protein